MRPRPRPGPIRAGGAAPILQRDAISETPAAQTPAPTIPCDRFRWPAGPDRRADAWEAHLASIYAVTVARDADRSAGIGLTTDNFGPVPLGSVSAVAYAAGVSSESAFCRAFHRRFGIRPRETGLSEALSGMGRETRPALLSRMETLAA